MSDPLVFPWRDSKPISSSKTLKLSSIPCTKMLNWAMSHMSADSSKAHEKNEHAWARSFICSHTSRESSSICLVIVCFDKATSFAFFFYTFLTNILCKFSETGLSNFFTVRERLMFFSQHEGNFVGYFEHC